MIYRAAFNLMQMLLVARRNRYLANVINTCQNIGDFGSGHNPYKHAHICVDKLDSDDAQRGGRSIIRSNKMIMHNVDLNSYPYPFKDKEFDFVLCNHVLEHLDDPVAACREFSRIAGAGYIEVPAFCSDAFMRRNDLIHKWLCLFEPKKGKLFFLDRRFFMEAAGPCRLHIWTRFFLSLKVTRVLWKGDIHGEYLTSGSWR
jgi:SAM-dependent methyltransferase